MKQKKTFGAVFIKIINNIMKKLIIELRMAIFTQILAWSVKLVPQEYQKTLAWLSQIPLEDYR